MAIAMAMIIAIGIAIMAAIMIATGTTIAAGTGAIIMAGVIAAAGPNGAITIASGFAAERMGAAVIAALLLR